MTFMRMFIPLGFAALLSACSLLQGQPMPPPPPAENAQLILYAQTGTLEKIGTASLSVRGTSGDADREMQRLADARGARYYTITLKKESRRTGVWTVRAVLYR